MSVTILDTLPESISTAKRGRPSKFTAEIQDAAKANPGKWVQVQEGVKGRSRLTELRNQFGEQGFTFKGVVTDKTPRTNKAGVEVTDEILTVYVSVPAVEVPETAPAPKARRGAKPAADTKA